MLCVSLGCERHAGRTLSVLFAPASLEPRAVSGTQSILSIFIICQVNQHMRFPMSLKWVLESTHCLLHSLELLPEEDRLRNLRRRKRNEAGRTRTGRARRPPEERQWSGRAGPWVLLLAEADGREGQWAPGGSYWPVRKQERKCTTRGVAKILVPCLLMPNRKMETEFGGNRKE